MKKYFCPFIFLTAIILVTTSCKKNVPEISDSDENEQLATTKAIIESIDNDNTTKTVTSNVMIPYDETFFVNTTTGGEDVHFTGQLHLVTKFSPVDPCRLFTNVVSLKGIGLQSNLEYQLAGSFESEKTVTAGGSFTSHTAIS